MMWNTVLLLSLVVAMDPVRIGITALLITRNQPMLNLFVFWLGGMVSGIAVATVALLWLRGPALSVMRLVLSAGSASSVAYVQVAIGVFAAMIAARMWARQHAPITVGVDGGPTAGYQREASRRSSRRSMRDRLERGSLTVAFVAGLALATPPVEYVAVLVTILASTATAGAQIGAALMFTIVAFTVVEVPLVSYFAAPARTLELVQRVSNWIDLRRRLIPAVVVAAASVLLIATGMNNL
jgi:hypothetical protein